MTCGNPTCRYEFCWLCMKEAVPNHFDYGPCEGKQFYDPDSFSYKLQQNHPCLYCLFSIFQCLFFFIILIMVFIVVPGFALTAIIYRMMSISFTEYHNKTLIHIILFFFCLCISFCIQSIIYMLWAIIFSLLAIIIVRFIISLVISILNYLLCCDSSDEKPDNEETE